MRNREAELEVKETQIEELKRDKATGRNISISKQEIGPNLASEFEDLDWGTSYNGKQNKGAKSYRNPWAELSYASLRGENTEINKTLNFGNLDNDNMTNTSNSRQDDSQALSDQRLRSNSVSRTNQPRDIEELMKRASRTIPEFKGNSELSTKLRTIELDRYLMGCAVMNKGAIRGEEEDILMCMKMRLTEDAYDLVNSRKCTTFGQLKELLNGTYRRDSSYDECLADLRASKQQPGEDATMFTERVENLYRAARKKLETDQPVPIVREALIKSIEKDTVNIVKEGVRDKQLYLFLRFHPDKCNSINQVLKEIQTYEKGHAAANQRDTHMDSINVLTDSSEEMKVMMNELKLMLEKSKEEQTKIVEMVAKRNEEPNRDDANGYQRQRRNSTGSRGGVTCYRCHQRGHIRKDCPVPKTEEEKHNERKRNDDSDKQKAVCWVCKKDNHDFYVCIEKYYKDKMIEAGERRRENQRSEN